MDDFDESFELFENLDTQPLPDTNLGQTTSAPGPSMPNLLGSGGVLGRDGGPSTEMPSLIGTTATGTITEGSVDLSAHPSGIVPTLQYILFY
jgi:hypothetical protein